MRVSKMLEMHVSKMLPAALLTVFLHDLVFHKCEKLEARSNMVASEHGLCLALFRVLRLSAGTVLLNLNLRTLL